MQERLLILLYQRKSAGARLLFVWTRKNFDNCLRKERKTVELTHLVVKWSCCCCCCLHIKSRSGLYSVLSNIRTGPTDADAFRGHRLTTQKGYTYQKEIKGPREVNTHAII